ncbi:peptidase associated/transthyretin-like domain-containing protein [Frigoriglobus tundricola]|uniref:Carboxypeptidase regulatory-like domain-containing protein n=1 Tax=Frigoriglobus tundricola TaxID=2774151 RepID=A0A6M5YZQ1_9BACT|nr:hypothetical protein [Frigoriglobus tundricola]QJW98900.1 hypothetical protein FTUN_6495 [Frigoriglobus tundricola]
MNKLAFSTAAVLALSCASCGDTNRIYPVSGRVTYHGAPAAGATVFFYRQGGDPVNEHSVMGIVREDGSFELVCGSLGTGAPPGEYDVAIEWKPVSGQSKGRPQHGPDKLKGRYADPKRPGFRVTIKPERNVLAPFEVGD